MPRLFVAVELPHDVRKQLATVEDEMGKGIGRIRWIPESNLHLTLQFLGNCSEELVSQIEERLKESVKKAQNFSFRLGSLGGFPSLKRARVLWVGVDEGDRQLVELQEIVEEALSSLGFVPEKRKFHPHVTLARLKIPQDLRGAISSVDDSRFRGFEVLVEEVTLFESKLKRSGALYISLMHAQLSSIDTNIRS